MMIQLILATSWTTFFLFIWFNTNILVSYSKLFGILKEFQEAFHKSNALYIADFLYQQGITRNDLPPFQKFFFTLLGCKFCLGFWLAAFFSAVFHTLAFLPLIYLISIFFHALLNKILEQK